MTAKTWFILSISVLCWFSLSANRNHPDKINDRIQDVEDVDGHQAKNLTSRILFPFFNENEAHNNGNPDDNDNEEEDGEYLTDLDNTKPFISPLENFPIIGNLLTGKKLDFSSHDTINNQQPSSTTRSDLINTGFDIAIKDSTTNVSLPTNVQSDLEDPGAEEIVAPPQTKKLMYNNNNKINVNKIITNTTSNNNNNTNNTTPISYWKINNITTSNNNIDVTSTQLNKNNVQTASYWKTNNNTNSNSNNTNSNSNNKKPTTSKYEEAQLSNNNDENVTTISFWKVNNRTNNGDTNSNNIISTSYNREDEVVALSEQNASTNNNNINNATASHYQEKFHLPKQNVSVMSNINHNNTDFNSLINIKNSNNIAAATSNRKDKPVSSKQNLLIPSSTIHNLMTDTSLERMIKHQHNQSDEIRILYARPNLVHQTPDGNLTLIDTTAIAHGQSQVPGMIQKSNKAQSLMKITSPDSSHSTSNTDILNMKPSLIKTPPPLTPGKSIQHELQQQHRQQHQQQQQQQQRRQQHQQQKGKSTEQMIANDKSKKTPQQQITKQHQRPQGSKVGNKSSSKSTHIQTSYWSKSHKENDTDKTAHQMKFKPSQIPTKFTASSTKKNFKNNLSKNNNKTNSLVTSKTWHPIASNATTQKIQTKKEHSHISLSPPSTGKRVTKPTFQMHQLLSHEITFKAKETDNHKINKISPQQAKINMKMAKNIKKKKQPITIIEKEKIKRNNKIQFVQLSPGGNNTNQQDAKCMDGSPPAYYIRKGYGNGQDKWIIHLHGGAWCYDLQSCSKRRSSILGSTKRSLEEDIGSFFHGILSNQPEDNPHFYNWNTVVLTYCDGGLFSGNRDKPLVGKGKKYYFQGRKVLKAQLDSIHQNTEMPSGKQFVLSGTSAGGLALILQANYIRHFLPEQAKIRGLVDAGFFLDQDSVYNTSISNVQFKALYSLHRPTLSRTCVEAQPLGNKFKCLFPQETVRNVKIPLFLVNSLYDHWQLSYLEGISCVYNNKCDRSSHDRILSFRNKMYSALNEASKWKNTTGVFANSCFAHGQVILDYTWSKSKVDGKTLSDAFHDWFVDDDVVKALSLPSDVTAAKRHVYTDCKLPCNGSCPSLLASRCVNNFIKASPERRKRDAELC